jgi:hypothetical protein
VPLVSGLEHEVARLCGDHLITEQGPELAFEHVAVLILVGMTVQRRRQRAWRDGMLDERELSAGLGGPDHEPHAEHAEVNRLAVGWTDDAGSG